MGRTKELEASGEGHAATNVSLGTAAHTFSALRWQLLEPDPTGSYQVSVPVSPHPHLDETGQAGTVSFG
jgi:hypothetical protein